MLANKETCRKYDLSSVRALFTGAAPLGAETAADLQKEYPKWLIRQGYGELYHFELPLSSSYSNL